VSRPALGTTQPPLQWVTGALSLGVKQPWRDADQSHPSSAEVMRGATHPLPHYVFMAWCCLVKYRDNFTFTLPPIYILLFHVVSFCEVTRLVCMFYLAHACYMSNPSHPP